MLCIPININNSKLSAPFLILHLLYLFTALKKLENGVLKLFLVNAICNNKSDKVTEFLSKMAPELQHQPEWSEWFCKYPSAIHFIN